MASSLILCNNNPFLNWIVTCDKKKEKDFIWQPTKTRSFLGWMEKKLQSTAPSQPSTKKKKAGVVMVTVWWSAAGLIHCSFLNPGKIKLMRRTKNCNCSQHLSTEWTQFFPMKMPNYLLHKQCFKSWMNWITKFCLIHHIHLTSCQLTSTSSSISIASCREDVSTTSKRQKMFSKSLSNPEAWGFLLQ